MFAPTMTQSNAKAKEARAKQLERDARHAEAAKRFSFELLMKRLTENNTAELGTLGCPGPVGMFAEALVFDLSWEGIEDTETEGVKFDVLVEFFIVRAIAFPGERVPFKVAKSHPQWKLALKAANKVVDDNDLHRSTAEKLIEESKTKAADVKTRKARKKADADWAKARKADVEKSRERNSRGMKAPMVVVPPHQGVTPATVHNFHKTLVGAGV